MDNEAMFSNRILGFKRVDLAELYLEFNIHYKQGMLNRFD